MLPSPGSIAEVRGLPAKIRLPLVIWRPSDVMDVAIRSTGYVLALQSKAVLASISLAQLWLSTSAKLVLTLLSSFGLLPNEYANRMKVSME